MKQMRLGALLLTVTLAMLAPSDAHAAVTLYPLSVKQPTGSHIIFTPRSKPVLRLNGKRAVWQASMDAYNPSTHVALSCIGWLKVKDRRTGATKRVDNAGYVWTNDGSTWYDNLDLRKAEHAVSDYPDNLTVTMTHRVLWVKHGITCQYA